MHMTCAACQKKVDVSGIPAGRQVGCPHCKEPIVVPHTAMQARPLSLLWIIALAVDGLALVIAVLLSLTSSRGDTVVITAPLWVGVIILFNYVLCRGCAAISRP